MTNQLQLIPVPRQVDQGTGTYELPATFFIQAQTESQLYLTMVNELQATLTTSEAQVRLRKADEAPADLMHYACNSEGYAFMISVEGIEIWASDPAGHYYGMMTLKQLLRQFGHRLPHLRIGDAPILRHRGLQIPLAQGLTEYRADYFKHLVPIIAGWKINALYVYLETYFDFPSIPHLGGPGAMTASDARELDELCSAYNIQLIPSINLLGHCGEILALQKYHHLIECDPAKDYRTETTYTLCPSSPEVRQLGRIMLSDLMDCFSSEVIFIGGDEVRNMGECLECSRSVQDKGKLGHYIGYFAEIKTFLNQHGRKAGLWGDMLIKHSAQATEDQWTAAANALATGSIIYDWHYRGGSANTLRMFKEAGFETIASGSTNLVYSSSVDLAQCRKLQKLYRDAVATGADGGMTTAWCNMYGMHEEQVNILTAVTGTLLWSDMNSEERSMLSFGETFEKAYHRQRYGVNTTALTEFWHILGDENGPVLKPLAPYNGVNIRKCLYHTDNVLMMWNCYSSILRGEKLTEYENGVRIAREKWQKIEEDMSGCGDPYIALQSAPLLMHEHLLRRFKITEEVYLHYDSAAKAQYANRKMFLEHMNDAASLLLSHLNDFAVIEIYLKEAHRLFGLEQASLLRMEATKRNIEELAAFFRYLTESNRPLPMFVHLYHIFSRAFYSNWFVDRQHEWACGPERFRRYSLQDQAWGAEPFSWKGLDA